MGNKAFVNVDIDLYPQVVTVKNVTGSLVLENGAIVGLGGLVDAARGRDCYKIVPLAVGCRFAILDDVALMYDETKDETDFVLEEGQIGRARLPHEGLCMTIAKKHVEGEVAVGDELELKADAYKLAKKDTGVAVARVEEVCTLHGQESLYIRFY